MLVGMRLALVDGIAPIDLIPKDMGERPDMEWQPAMGLARPRGPSFRVDALCPQLLRQRGHGLEV